MTTVITKTLDQSPSVVPTATLRPEAAPTSGQRSRTFRVGSGTAASSSVRRALARIMADGISDEALGRIRAISRNEMWRLDRSWAPDSSVVDPRLCMSGDIRPYDPDDCGGSPICEWGYLSVQKDCSAETFLSVMFQQIRYIWCQTQLSDLLENKPTEPKRQTRRSAEAWADWCIQVMRLVSLANWSTNMHPSYLVPLNERPRASEVSAEILSWLPVPHWVPEFSTLTIAEPRSFEPVPWASFEVPTRAYDFNPVWVARHPALRFTVNLQRRSYLEKPWPWEFFRGRAPGNTGTGLVGQSRVRDALVTWFERTLDNTGGTNLWWKGNRVRSIIMGRKACSPFELGPCRRQERVSHWWGAGNVQVLMCEAWAEDIVRTSFGQLVGASLERFSERYDAIPDEYKSLTNAQLTEAIQAFRQTLTNEITAAVSATFSVASSAVSAIPVVGPFVGVALQIVGALTSLLIQIGGAAIGGGIIASYCIPTPVIRQISSMETNACEFDPRDGQAQRVASQVSAIAAAAMRDLPVNIWFEASKAGAGEDSLLTRNGEGGGSAEEGEGGIHPLLIAGGVGLLGLLGYAALRKE